MDCQSYEIVTSGSDVINELREKINNLHYELEHLKGRETVPINSLFQDDLNKIKTGLSVCSNAIQSTNDLFKTSDKKNAEISNELKALKREVDKRFDEEKDLRKPRNEPIGFLKEGMAKLQNIAKQLGNEVKNLKEGLKEEYEEQMSAACSVTQSTQDLLKNSEKRITETSNELEALEKEISKCLSDRTEALNELSIVKEEDQSKLRNGVLNVYSSGIQVHGINKEMGSEIKNLDVGLKKQQEKIDSIVESTNMIKKTRKFLNIRQSMTENSMKQFSSEIKKLQSEFKAEQQRNRILENKLMTFEILMKEMLMRNDIKHNPNKEISFGGASLPNPSPKQPAFVPETCKLEISDPQTKEEGQMHDFGGIYIVSKDHDDINFNEEVKSKCVCEEVRQKDGSEEGYRVTFPGNAEAFYEKESSRSSIHSQIDELTENQCTDFTVDSISGKEGRLSYLEKAHAYLQNLQMAEMFPLSDEESSALPDDGSSVTCDLRDDTKKDCGEKKKKLKEKYKEIIISDTIKWAFPHKASSMKDNLYLSNVFYTGTPGYRLQVLAKIDQTGGNIFFCFRVLKGVNDKDLSWPCQQGIIIRTSKKMKPTGMECLLIPEKNVLTKPKSRKEKVYTEWSGPFSLSQYLKRETLIFYICLG